METGRRDFLKLIAVAAGGVRVTNAVGTTALCSPTRVALLTGHNHHANNAGAIIVW